MPARQRSHGPRPVGASLLFKQDARNAPLRVRLMRFGSAIILGSYGARSAPHLSRATALWFPMSPLAAGNAVEFWQVAKLRRCPKRLQCFALRCWFRLNDATRGRPRPLFMRRAASAIVRGRRAPCGGGSGRERGRPREGRSAPCRRRSWPSRKAPRSSSPCEPHRLRATLCRHRGVLLP
jgi:hypothetical protein